tara:strand:+ start:1410 stop:2108 length:699 start_codon:yes stop_codon:yes gene_type:complete
MDNLKDHRFFLFISLHQISFEVLDSKNNVYFKKKTKLKDLSKIDNFRSVENFLDENIFQIEKTLDMYVEEINLIINYRDFFSVNLSIKSSLKDFDINRNISSSLIDLKNQFKKTIGDYEIVHMIINKFIVDGADHKSLPNDIVDKNISIEVSFICLQYFIINELKKILSKYQISVKKTFFYEYLKNFRQSNEENFSITASNILAGINENEILLLNKSRKKAGFFEKFFKFFS